MNAEKLVPTRETCERLRDAGWTEPTYFDWHYYDVRDFWEAEPADVHWMSETIPAPTLAELLDALNSTYSHYDFRRYNDAIGIRYALQVWIGGVSQAEYFAYSKIDNPAEAAAALWLQLQPARAGAQTESK